jgi:hypothetical protein
MKNLVTALMILALSPVMPLAASATSLVAPSAQLQLFLNYDPETKKYDKRIVVGPSSSVSAEELIREGTGVCYRSSIEGFSDLRSLLEQMIELYNRSEPRFEMELNDLSVGPAPETVTFTITQRTETGSITHTWPSVRRCMRLL